MADEEHVAIPLVWEEPDEGSTVIFANQFLIQHQPDEFVLTIGQLIGPPLLGTDEEKREQLARLNYVPVRILGRFGLTRRRLQELIDILQTNLENHDAMIRRREGEDGP